MAHDVTHQPAQAKKDGPEPAKKVEGTPEHAATWFGTNAQEFVDWADRVTNHFADVTPAMFEAIKAAYDALAPSDRATVKHAARDKRELLAMLSSPVYATFLTARRRPAGGEREA